MEEGILEALSQDQEIANARQAEQIFRKVSWRLIPFMLLLYVIAYLDRINISFAALQMNHDLNFTDEQFGAGAGAFFIGYFLFGVPSNLMVSNLGARKWIALIMIVWGFISASMCLVQDIQVFLWMRFFLGVAEAGFFPGMILYLTYWFPKREHAKAVARFMTAIPLSGILGGVISSAIFKMHGFMGLAGWKWLFLITGSPAVILGAVVLFVLSDGPSECKWLSAEERSWLIAHVSADQIQTKKDSVARAVFGNPRVWLLASIYFCLALGMYGFQLWLPQIIKSFDNVDDSTVALLSAIPAVFQALGMVFVASHSDKKKERRLHLSMSAALAATGLMTCGFCHNPWLSLACLCLTAFGIWGTVGPFWAIPTSFLGASSAAAGIGLINSIGSLGGFVGPNVVGFIKQHHPDFIYSLAALAVSLMVAGFLALLLKSPVKE
jgi:ACS family tartrate transporter-like MFS transporter